MTFHVFGEELEREILLALRRLSIIRDAIGARRWVWARYDLLKLDGQIQDLGDLVRALPRELQGAHDA
jgi:hypothetical protein